MGLLDNGNYGITIYGASGNVVLSQEGMMQSYGFVEQDNVDNSNPLYVTFYVDEGVTEVRALKLHLLLDNFRAYEQGAAASGSSYPTSNVNNLFPDEAWGWSDEFNYYRLILEPDEGSSNPITYSMLRLYFNHAHKTSIPSHTHTIQHGIFKSAKASNVNIKIGSNIIAFGVNSNTYDIDVRQYITPGAWNTIEIGSGTLGRIVCSVYSKIFVTT